MLYDDNKHKYMRNRFFGAKKLELLGILLVACFMLPSLTACVNGQGTSSSSLGVVSGTPTSAAKASGSTPTSATPTPASASSGAVALNTTITYASVDITIVDVKQAKTFADDAITSTSDVLRLDLKESNTSTGSSSCDYDYVARLLLPDGTTAEPLKTEDTDSIDASTTRNNWVDFPVSLSVPANRISLQIGKATEAQEVIPLTAGADVSKYAPKSSTPNVTMTYGKIDWTVTNATSELSYKDIQANKGMMFVVVDLNANNKGSSSGGGDLVQVQLKSGSTANPSQEFLNDVAGYQTNVTSTVSFVMPQGSTNFTLVFLPSNAYGITTASSVNFQIA